MEKLNLTDYENWCVKNNKDQMKSETLKEYTEMLEKKEKASEDKERAKKQKAVCGAISEYLGIEYHYDARYLEPCDMCLENLLKTFNECYEEREQLKKGAKELSKDINDLLDEIIKALK